MKLGHSGPGVMWCRKFCIDGWFLERGSSTLRHVNYTYGSKKLIGLCTFQPEVLLSKSMHSLDLRNHNIFSWQGFIQNQVDV